MTQSFDEWFKEAYKTESVLVAEDGWNARQAEIDKLQSAIDELQKRIDDGMNIAVTNLAIPHADAVYLVKTLKGEHND